MPCVCFACTLCSVCLLGLLDYRLVVLRLACFCLLSLLLLPLGLIVQYMVGVFDVVSLLFVVCIDSCIHRWLLVSHENVTLPAACRALLAEHRLWQFRVWDCYSFVCLLTPLAWQLRAPLTRLLAYRFCWRFSNRRKNLTRVLEKLQIFTMDCRASRSAGVFQGLDNVTLTNGLAEYRIRLDFPVKASTM